MTKLDPKSYVKIVTVNKKTFEDNFYADDCNGVYVVSDGRRDRAGEDASGFITSLVGRRTSAVIEHAKEIGALDNLRLEELLPEYLNLAQQRALLKEYGATLDLMVVHEPFADIFHLGDSRVSLICKDEHCKTVLKTVTREHSNIGRAIEYGGVIRSEEEAYIVRHQRGGGPILYIGKPETEGAPNVKFPVSLPVVELHSKDNIARVLPDICVTRINLEEWGSRYVLMSTDGLIARVTDQEVVQFFAEFDQNQEFLDALLERIRGRIVNPQEMIALARRYAPNNAPLEVLEQDDTTMVLIDLYGSERSRFFDVVGRSLEEHRKYVNDLKDARQSSAKEVRRAREEAEETKGKLVAAEAESGRIKGERDDYERLYNKTVATKGSVESKLVAAKNNVNVLEERLREAEEEYGEQIKTLSGEHEATLKTKDDRIVSLDAQLEGEKAKYKELEDKYEHIIGIIGERPTSEEAVALWGQLFIIQKQYPQKSEKAERIATTHRRLLTEIDSVKDKYVSLEERVNKTNDETLTKQYEDALKLEAEARKKLEGVNPAELSNSLKNLSWLRDSYKDVWWRIISNQHSPPHAIAIESLYKQLDEVELELGKIGGLIETLTAANNMLTNISERYSTLREREDDIEKREKEFEEKGFFTMVRELITEKYTTLKPVIKYGVGGVAAVALAIAVVGYKVMQPQLAMPMLQYTQKQTLLEYSQKAKATAKQKQSAVAERTSTLPPTQEAHDLPDVIGGCYLRSGEGTFIVQPTNKCDSLEETFKEEKLYISRKGSSCYEALVRQVLGTSRVYATPSHEVLAPEAIGVVYTNQAIADKKLLGAKCNLEDNVSNQQNEVLARESVQTATQEKSTNGKKPQQKTKEPDYNIDKQSGAYKITQAGGTKAISRLFPGKQELFVANPREKCHRYATIKDGAFYYADGSKANVYWGYMVYEKKPSDNNMTECANQTNGGSNAKQN